MLKELEKQGVAPALLKRVENFISSHSTPEKDLHRIPKPHFIYLGKSVWEQALTAILQGENLLLSGAKATGKNVLAENLATLFQRPEWTVSFHTNTDQALLIGMDTFRNGEVEFRNGPITEAALQGGFCVLDEINMAKNEAIAVLHSALDHRRLIDIPGYDLIPVQDATRFIATMNHGYLGTKELNEALLSRFVVIEMPLLSDEGLLNLLSREFPNLKEESLKSFIKFFGALVKKSENAEISTKPIDLRGLMAAIQLNINGLHVYEALDLGIANKCFDAFETEIVRDTMKLYFTKDFELEFKYE